MAVFFGVNKKFTQADLGEVSALIGGAELIYAATNLPLDYLYELVAQCREQVKPLFLDVPNQQKIIDKSVLMQAGFVAPNRQEAELLLDMPINSLADARAAAEKLRRFGPAGILISLDRDGAILMRGNEIAHAPAPQVEVVDTTAAGDILRAAFVSNYLKTADVQQSLAKAVQVASQSTEVKGVDRTLKSLSQ